MKSISKPIWAVMTLLIAAALAGCTLGQAAAPTPTAVDVNAVMTSAAATAFVELTSIAAKASATTPPTATPTQTATQAATADPNASATPDQALILLTPTEAAGGLPAVATATLAPGGLPQATGVPSLTPFVPAGAGTSTVITCYNAKFVADVTVPDGTVYKPYEKFYKVWRIQNTGTCAWDEGFGLVMWAGDAMNGNAIYFSKHDNRVEPGGTVDLGIEMRAPPQPGEYYGHWVMINDQGKTFGGDLMVFIKVAK